MSQPVKIKRICYVCAKCGLTAGYEEQPCPLCASRQLAEESRETIAMLAGQLADKREIIRRLTT